jgi:hypothetical protein
MTVEEMRELVKKHSDLETKLDLEGMLATLVENPIYEFHPARLRLYPIRLKILDSGSENYH